MIHKAPKFRLTPKIIITGQFENKQYIHKYYISIIFCKIVLFLKIR